jgi:hypothetical protein
MTKTDWTKEKVRREAANQKIFGSERACEMLTAFAERIEADESALATSWIIRDEHDVVREVTCDAARKDTLLREGMTPVLTQWTATPQFTHPPAQAAQVDLQKVFDALHRSAPIPEIIRHVPGVERLHAEAHAMVRDALAALSAPEGGEVGCG